MVTLQARTLEQLLEQVSVGQQHATPAVVLPAQCIQGSPLGVGPAAPRVGLLLVAGDLATGEAACRMAMAAAWQPAGSLGCPTISHTLHSPDSSLS